MNKRQRKPTARYLAWMLTKSRTLHAATVHQPDETECAGAVLQSDEKECTGADEQPNETECAAAAQQPDETECAGAVQQLDEKECTGADEQPDETEYNSSATHFLKFEDVTQCCRPHFVEYKSAPSINLSGDISLGIFTSSEAKNDKKMTSFQKKHPAAVSQYCECCDTTYTRLDVHLRSYQHRMFTLTASNYKELDSLIQSVNSMSTFSDSCQAVNVKSMPLEVKDKNICHSDQQRTEFVPYGVLENAASKSHSAAAPTSFSHTAAIKLVGYSDTECSNTDDTVWLTTIFCFYTFCSAGDYLGVYIVLLNKPKLVLRVRDFPMQ